MPEAKRDRLARQRRPVPDHNRLLGDDHGYLTSIGLVWARQHQQLGAHMSYAHVTGGGVVHFPSSYRVDKDGAIVAPAASELSRIADTIRHDQLLSFTRTLWKAAKRRRQQAKWKSLNDARRQLALLCADRALSEGLPETSVDKALGGWRRNPWAS